RAHILTIRILPVLIVPPHRTRAGDPIPIPAPWRAVVRWSGSCCPGLRGVYGRSLRRDDLCWTWGGWTPPVQHAYDVAMSPDDRHSTATTPGSRARSDGHTDGWRARLARAPMSAKGGTAAFGETRTIPGSPTGIERREDRCD